MLTHYAKEKNFKTNALKRIRAYFKIEVSKVTYGSYIYSNFTYCPLICMFGSKANNTKINKAQKQAPRIVYDYGKYLELLDIVAGTTIQFLMTKVYVSESPQSRIYMEIFPI